MSKRKNRAAVEAVQPTEDQVAEDRVYGLSKDKLTRAEVKVAVAANREAGKTRLYPNLQRYERVTLGDGRKVIDNADEVAQLLRGCAELGDVWRLFAEHAKPEVVEECRAKYGRLNPGMQRMNIGNRLRGIFKAQRQAEVQEAAQG